MKKYIRILNISATIMLAAAGCGGNADKKESSAVPVIEDFDAMINDRRTQVIVRDEAAPSTTESTEEPETAAETAPEVIIPYVDRIAGDNIVTYDIEKTVYEDGVIKVEYPQLTGLPDEGRQQEINEKIRAAAVGDISTENLGSYELKCETASRGNGIVSFIFRGTSYYENSAYPNNVIRTLNIDLATGQNVRLKDYADIAMVVNSLENAEGYMIINENVDAADFSAYLNNGAVTDYAITLLDYDIDFGNQALVPAGFSAIRNNHLILFIEAEHAMGDYVELEFLRSL